MNTLARLVLKPTLAFGGHVSRRPTIQPRIRSYISKTRDEGIRLAAQLEKEGVCVFADGSGISGGVGGAARIRTSAGTIIMTQYIGSADRHLSVEGELLGTILALKIAQTIPSLTRVTILSDCQQAIRELLRERPTRHRSLVEGFYRELRCTPSLKQILLVWVPGHDGVEMNELVDGDAKAAARGESRTTIISGGFQIFV